ncbi:MarR family winged helix-turn-helix transcriptional regulator [Acetobacter fallax]|uniref:MarR family transcriptional regulator n=1 Tax=Acetobacter fallax TaxID=1737473 RepID=A0ABX0KCD0_9PROT|nr:MarR family transcriptional regulator [Acetobacter fallax]NHO32160.1 MarR family transcriptional regulator [Acetobacter fallax]NHO35787.1 MarR family transcriptional regulator [Acetobacter fallax]
MKNETPGPSAPPDETLATRLMDALKPLVRNNQAEIMALTAELDLTLSQGRILLELSKAEEDLANTDIATRITLSVAATTRAVDALYRSGLVTRREDEADRRIKRIGLTNQGRAIISAIMEIKRRSVERFIAALSSDERTALDAAVNTIATLTATRWPADPDTSMSSFREPRA